MKHIIFSLAIVLTPIVGWCQVGIDNPTPHPSAVLDLSGDSNSTRGLLIPTTTAALVTTPTANGLLIFDETDSKYHFWHEASAQWMVINPWESTSTGNQMTIQSKQVGIGTTSPDDALDVVGNIEASDTIKAAHIDVTGFSSNAMVPTGGIIMWSGTSIPSGWKLCDGTNNTPDLRGRFIAGYVNQPVTPYNNPGNFSTGGSTAGYTDGEASVSLTTAQLPPHHHEGNTNGATINITSSGEHTHSWTNGLPRKSGIHFVGNGSGESTQNRNEDTQIATSGNHIHPNSSFDGVVGDGSSQGLVGQAHENRPPFYVLAFIMKE